MWRDEDIVDLIEEVGDSIALVYFSGGYGHCYVCDGIHFDWCSGVHYSTGHFFDVKAITEAGHRKVNRSIYGQHLWCIAIGLLCGLGHGTCCG